MQALIANFKKVMNEEVTSIKSVTSGLSNDNYLINNRYMMRVPKDFNQPFNSRKIERQIEVQLKDFPLSLNVLYIDEQGIKISDFIKNAKSFSEIKHDQKHIRLAARALRTFHDLQITCDKSFNYLERLDFYKEKSFLREVPNENKIISMVKKWDKMSKKIVCHNDLVGGNIIFDQNKTYLIDFEYASNNDPMFDIVSFLSENNINDNYLIEDFLEEYYNHDLSSFDYIKFMDFFPILDLIWYYWAEMMNKKTHDDIYRLIANTKLKRLETYKL